jgi:hypothetical protein
MIFSVSMRSFEIQKTDESKNKRLLFPDGNSKWNNNRSNGTRAVFAQ